MTNLNKLKQKIAELVPEIMKFQTGSRVVIENEPYKETHVIESVKMNKYNDKVPEIITTCCGVMKPTSANDFRWKRDSIGRETRFWKHIGRPINLEDVLIALPDDIKIASDQENGTLINSKLAELLTLWDFGNPLSKQSEETINFLSEILL